MAVAGVNDGALDQSLLKAPVTEIVDLSSGDVESPISHSEEGQAGLTLAIQTSGLCSKMLSLKRKTTTTNEFLTLVCSTVE